MYSIYISQQVQQTEILLGHRQQYIISLAST